jgi:murein L,D-transpeptidase YafK
MSIFRALLSTLALLCLAVAPSTFATELLAKADTRMPAATMYKPADIQSVSKVVVRKGERRLYLMDGEDVVRSYRISLGDNPEGHKLYEGDERTPEGDYTLDWRNAESDFYGLDWTDGCIAVTNDEMDEIWQLVSNGTPISIHP